MSELTLRTEFMIDGKVVNLVFEFCGIKVYQYENEFDDFYISYFVKGDKVVATHKFSADCAQNMGYISDNSWS